MKVLLSVLVTVGFVLCEVPPPYPARGFRPSPPFNLPFEDSSSRVRQPQTAYSAPNTFPSKLSSSSLPQLQYNAPNNVESLGTNAPNLTPNFSSKQTIPRTSYGVPITEGSGSFQNKFRIINSQPQTTYGVPSSPNIPSQPQTQYGAPDTRNVETLDQIRQLNFLLQSQNINRNVVPASQYLPAKQTANFAGNFHQPDNINLNILQSQNSNRNIGQPVAQYLPIKNAVDFGNGQLPQSNAPNQLNLQTSDQNVLQQPSQQYLPVKDASNFRKGFGFPEPDLLQIGNQNFPNNNNGILPNRPEPSFHINSQNIDIPFTQNQEPQFGNNLQNSNTVIPGNKYVPPEANFPPITNGPTNFNQQAPPPLFNQQIPVNPGTNTPRFPNVNPSFAQASAQGNVEIQQADVRKLQSSATNIGQIPPVNVGKNLVTNSFRQSNIDSNVDVQQGFVRKPHPTDSRTNTLQIPVHNRQNLRPTEPVDERYLPPTTTVRTIPKPSSASPPNKPSFEDEDQSSTEADEVAGGPNIAIATAVSGAPGGQSFYLLQPDGRLQRVVYQKSREEGDQENEYTANYYFQNIQAQPNLVYSPLISLGK